MHLDIQGIQTTSEPDLVNYFNYLVQASNELYHTHTRARTHVRTHTRTHTRAHAHTHTHTHTHTHATTRERPKKLYQHIIESAAPYNF